MIFSAKRLARFSALLFLLCSTLNSCDKYSSPRKVERFITEGDWIITSAFIDNQIATNLYSTYKFRFHNANSIEVIGDPTITGQWGTSAQKNPTAISFSFTPFPPFNQLNKDWTFTLCTEERMEIEQDGSGTKDLLVFEKLN